MIRRLAWALALLLFSAAPAAAQSDTDERCWDDPNRASCLQSRADRLVETYGARRIEAHRDAGDQVVRIFFWHNQDLALIAFVRAPGHEPRAYVSFPRQRGRPAPAAMEAPIPAAVWYEALDRAAYADRTFVPLPPRQPESQTVCIHPTVYVFEANDPAVPVYEMPARIRRHSSSSCDDAPLFQFATDLRRLALPLFPACEALDPEGYGDALSRLRTCQRLSGDRLLAAEVMNLAVPLGNINGPDDLRRLQNLFDYQAAIDWNGRRRRPEEGSTAAFWLARYTEDHVAGLGIESAEGLTNGQVRLSGHLRRDRPGANDGTSQSARFEQIWARTVSGTQVTSFAVGPWETQPD
jgi:hypothetical protein